MSMPMGIAFAPTYENAAEARTNGASETPIADAIKVLSLQMPRFTGARGIAPDALLQSFGSGGIVGGHQTPGGLEMFLRRLVGVQLPFGLNVPPSAPGSATSASSYPTRPGTPLPNPKVVPGQQSGQPWWYQYPEPSAPLPQPETSVLERKPGGVPGGAGGGMYGWR